MENRPPFNRELLIPILIGGFSIVGIVVVLLIGRSLSAPAQVATTPSATPFEYIYLGTEPAVSTPFVDSSESPPLDDGFVVTPPVGPVPEFGTFVVTPPAGPVQEIGTPTGGSGAVFTPTRSSSASTPLIIGTLNATFTPSAIALRTFTASVTSVIGTAVAANTYDDTDARLTYSPAWLTQTGLSGAYQNTLHVSDAVGNFVTFTFTGQELQLYFQTGPSLGTLTITFDNDTLGTQLNQGTDDGVEVYTLTTGGAHTVTIRHTGGGSVNLDRLVIPASTPTPGPSPTPTQ